MDSLYFLIPLINTKSKKMKPRTHTDSSFPWVTPGTKRQNARPFDQELWSSLIYFFYLHKTIRPTYIVLIYLFFLLCTTIRPKIRVLVNLFLLSTHDHSPKIYGPLPYTLPLCTIIRPKIRVLIYLFICARQSTKIRGHSYSLNLFFYYIT